MGKKVKSIKNGLPGGFLKKYRIGKGEQFTYIPLAAGFVRMEYAEEEIPLLLRAAFVADPSEFSPAIGNLLEFGLNPDHEGEEATFIAETGVSGFQWSDGAVRWGHTYDDDSPPPEGETIGLDDWVDRCVVEMINPREGINPLWGIENSGNAMKGIGTPFDIKGSIAKIKRGDEETRDRFWKKCTPRTKDEASLVLGLLRYAVAHGDGDLLFACCDPLKRAATDHDAILEAVTTILEGIMVKEDYDRSELEEIMAAHGDKAGPDLIGRWISLVEKSLQAHGAEALHAINEGALISALAKIPRSDGRLLKFFNRILSLVEGASPSVRNDVKGLRPYILVKKAMKAKK